jgi:hypothetical protein
MNEDYFLYTVGTTVKTVTRVRTHHSVKHIPEEAFRHCNRLVEVELNRGLRRIGRWAFGSCRSLLRIIIPSSVKIIDEYAFFNCTALVEVELHEGLRTIGRAGFRQCSSLLRVNTPMSVSPLVMVHSYTARHWYRSSSTRAFKGLDERHSTSAAPYFLSTFHRLLQPLVIVHSYTVAFFGMLQSHPHLQLRKSSLQALFLLSMKRKSLLS